MTIKQLFLLALLATPTIGYSMDSSSSSSSASTNNSMQQLLSMYDDLMLQIDQNKDLIELVSLIDAHILKLQGNEQDIALTLSIFNNRLLSPTVLALLSRSDLTSSKKWQIIKTKIDFFAQPTHEEKEFASIIQTELTLERIAKNDNTFAISQAEPAPTTPVINPELLSTLSSNPIMGITQLFTQRLQAKL